MLIRGTLKTWIILVFCTVVAACTKETNQVGAASGSPIAYDSYSCPQLIEEVQRVSSRAAQATGAQDQNATIDKLATAAGVIIYWPVLSTLKGNDTHLAEFAHLRAQMDAIEQASLQNKCNIAFRPAPPTEQPAVKNDPEFH